ncbi:MAG TPA: GNAT family N-acetyltransferase [Streptosporangiales bacterium]
MSTIELSTLADRPDLTGRLYELPNVWPEFLGHDPVTNAFLHLVAADFPRHCVVATDGDRIVAHGRSIPFALDAPGRGALPAGGVDRVTVWAYADHREGTTPDTVSALAIEVDPEYTGRGLSARLLGLMRQAAADAGFAALVAPVRPNRKHEHPHLTMAEYLAVRRDDGLPSDPWVRTHVRAGATIEAIAPASMTVTGSLADWRAWTGLPFDRAGEVVVPGALVPVRCDPAHDVAVYVEPNVWMRHPLTRRGKSVARARGAR